MRFERILFAFGLATAIGCFAFAPAFAQTSIQMLPPVLPGGGTCNLASGQLLFLDGAINCNPFLTANPTNGALNINGQVFNDNDVYTVNILAGMQQCDPGAVLTKDNSSPNNNSFKCVQVAAEFPACPKGDALISNGTDSNGNTMGYGCQSVPTNGVCGGANGQTFASMPNSNLCASSAPPTGMGDNGQSWTWSCSGDNGGMTASCFAFHQAVNGTCGPANGQSYTTPPTSGLCSTGTPSTSGAWAWSCQGSYGGSSASCSATQQQVTYNVANDCAGNFCAADQGTANAVCVQHGFSSAASYQTYSITSSNPYNGAYTGNEAWWNGSGWSSAWGGQCNTGGRCTPENWSEIYQVTCQ